MRFALCQISSTADPQENLATVRDEVAAAAANGARVVQFPEATQCRFGVPLKPIAEPLGGPWATAVREIADEHNVVVVAGMFTPGEGDRVTNTTLVTGAGLHLGYDKIHLFDAFGFRESDTVTPGEKPVTFEVDGTTIGLATCYDVRFPELFRALAATAPVILLGASWGAGPGKADQWDLLVRARALDATSWILACGQADPAADHGSAPTGIGRSAAIDPIGSVRERLEGAPGTILSDVDTHLVDEVRAKLPVLANRRL
ncbi:carbon-nitrogen hydrolase family protein [Lentzea sp. BCCO 10_0061]|uniref:Carbon-nitrogen hydrolase family protein n=1 Tax=Lentzea sokolovensis TaxID=3095429 RepID=A0ABU4V4P2_9PSEU|nr:carbon-nitrogen hydrolase family protein [Lentzea sp. BCCO 10_0061]MDX8146756.1 carbon-nitrogen hydrolase family protein [Lentzea sp. BCCO 10_0061]